MTARAILGLLMTAALLGAPSSASAAGNELHDPAITPTSGSTTTVFAVSVRYDGKFQATAVTAELAGLKLPMSLAEGTPLAGTWVASSPLPAGRWTLAITAVAERGNVASVSGPTVTVSGATTPGAPEPPPPKPPDSSSPKEVGSPPGTSGEVPTQTAAPVELSPIAAPDSVPHDAAGAVQDAAGPADEAAGATDVDATGVAAGGDAGPGPVPTEGGGPASVPMVLSAPTGGVERASDAAIVDEATEGVVPGVLLAAFGVLAGITLIGTPVLVAMRRRFPREGNSLPAAAETTAATLQRRALRRAKIRVDDDDPILVSMGFGPGEAERSAARKHRAAGRPDRRRPT